MWLLQVLTRLFFFFFSSRRRHTRLQGDWSSDVCSSDLILQNDDRRVVFMIPWEGRFTLVGTTDIPAAAPDQAETTQDEVDYLCRAVNRRSGERRVGEECRTRWAPDHLKKKKCRATRHDR